MKRFTLFILAAAALASCSKSSKGSPGSGSATVCTCSFVYRPGRDTIVKYSMDAASAITVDSQCSFQSAAVKKTYGNGSCSL